MPRKRKTATYSIVYVNDLGSVSEDRIYNPESEPKENLLDELQCPVADDVLIALRKAFSLTFPRNPFVEGLQAALNEIRRIGVKALKPLPEILTDLELPPLPKIINDPIEDKSYVFQFAFARRDTIDITVNVDGRRRKLLDLIGNEDGTQLIVTLRAVVSDTFSEAHDEEQHDAILKRIRHRIHEVLPAFNVCLNQIEIEPIAAMEAVDQDGSKLNDATNA